MINIYKGFDMVNKINDSNNPLRPVNKDARLNGKVPSQSSETTSSNQEEVSISFASKQIDALMSMIEDTPQINEAKVAYLRGEVNSGNYKIDSDKIAEKMISLGEFA